MKLNLFSAPSMFSRLTGLRRTGLRWSLLRLNPSLRIFRFARCGWPAGRLRSPAIIVEKLEGGEAAVKRQHHLASFDLTDLPSFDLIADLCAQDFLVRPGANDGAGALPVHHNTEKNEVRRRRRTTTRRKQRAIEYR